MEHNFTWKNDGRTKVMIGCGTRPEIIRLLRLSSAAGNILTAVWSTTTRTGTETSPPFSGGFRAKKHLWGIWPRHSGARGRRESGRDLRQYSGTQL